MVSQHFVKNLLFSMNAVSNMVCNKDFVRLIKVIIIKIKISKKSISTQKLQ